MANGNGDKRVVKNASELVQSHQHVSQKGAQTGEQYENLGKTKDLYSLIYMSGFLIMKHQKIVLQTREAEVETCDRDFNRLSSSFQQTNDFLVCS